LGSRAVERGNARGSLDPQHENFRQHGGIRYATQSAPPHLLERRATQRAAVVEPQPVGLRALSRRDTKQGAFRFLQHGITCTLFFYSPGHKPLILLEALKT
jgi:hypothetical protein